MHLIPLPIVLFVGVVAFIAFVAGFWIGWRARQDPEMVKVYNDLEEKYGTGK